MQIQVINDQDRDNAIAEIRRLTETTHQLGSNPVYAEAYGESGLVTILGVRAERGQREILVLDCSLKQVQAVLDWKAGLDGEELEDLIIHLVRKA